jgi:hypothetical protein
MDGLYGEGGGAAKPAESVDQENQEGGKETVIAKTILPPDTKEGDTCTFQITKDYGDEFGLKYLSKTSGSPAEGGTAEADNKELEGLDQGQGY